MIGPRLIQKCYRKYKYNGLKSLTKEGLWYSYKNLARKFLNEQSAIDYPLSIRRAYNYRTASPPNLLSNKSVTNYQYKNKPTFFGYFDISPFDTNDKHLLACHKQSKYLNVGFFDLQSHEFTSIDQTKAWSWQQGCRLQWLDDQKVIYNIERDQEYHSKIFNVKEKKLEKEISYPIYSVDSQSKFALSFNFSRLSENRKGYGYDMLSDRFDNQPSTSTDGIWKINLSTGERRLIVSIEDIANLEKESSMESANHWINHVFISPDDTRFVFLHRWTTNDGWKTRLLVCDCDGNDLTVLQKEGHPSHMAWKSDNELLSTVVFKEPSKPRCSYILYNISAGKKQNVYTNLSTDGHPSYAPDGRLVTDTKPNHLGEREILVGAENRINKIGSIYNPWTGKRRCDPHPRWNSDYTKICIDSVHSGTRSMCVFDLEKDSISPRQ